MKITAIEAIPFGIPYTKPCASPAGRSTPHSMSSCGSAANDGLVGVAEAPARLFTYGETLESIVAPGQTLFRASRRFIAERAQALAL